MIFFVGTLSDPSVLDVDYAAHVTSTRVVGLENACAVTTIGGNLGGRSKQLVGWRSLNLYPQTAAATIVDCDSRQPLVVDDLRLEQTWTDPTCSLTPDTRGYERQYTPIRGNYADSAGASSPDGWWRIPMASCTARGRQHITGAVGVATAGHTSSLSAKPPRYRLIWDHPYFWQVGPALTSQFCLDATVTVTVRLSGHHGSAEVPAKPVCVND